MARELLTDDNTADQKHSFHTKATDVWAFGMVIYVSPLNYKSMGGKIIQHGPLGDIDKETTVLPQRE